jgi:hypothetical protein
LNPDRGNPLTWDRDRERERRGFTPSARCRNSIRPGSGSTISLSAPASVCSLPSGPSSAEPLAPPVPRGLGGLDITRKRNVQTRFTEGESARAECNESDKEDQDNRKRLKLKISTTHRVSQGQAMPLQLHV